MSQHDYAIADAAGATFLADLNLALPALASLSSGATAPSTTYAYMLWADTTSGWLKQRDAANAAWILRAPLGTGAAVDVASAATLDLTANSASSATLRVTGTTGTTAITLTDGQQRLLRAAAAWPITHGTSLICPGSANYTCAAGDLILAIGEAAGVVRLMIWKADGTPVVASGGGKIQDFRLTLTSGLPVTTSDITAATTIYATPYAGNQIALYSGSVWNVRSSAEFSLALGTLTSGKPYDVFCYDNSGTPTLEAVAWTDDTTRATALAYQDGVLVKSGATTRRYLGTFYTTSTTTTEDSATKRYLYNYYHRKARRLTRLETTASWTYSTASWRQANASTSNQVNFVIGVAEDSVSLTVQAAVESSTAGDNCSIGIGVDSTSATTATQIGGHVQIQTGGRRHDMTCSASVTPAAGRHYAAWLEYGAGANTQTWYGVYASTISFGIGGEVWG